MPPTDDLTPETEPALAPDGEVAEPEHEVVDLPLPPSGTTRVDPLDQLDSSALLAEAKKFRAIAQRKAEKKEVSTNQPTQPSSDFKRELARINTKKATKEAMKNSEIADNWDDIRTLYVNRNGQDDPDDILVDINDAFTLWKAKKPVAPGNPAHDLQRSSLVKHGGSTPPVQGRQSQSLLQKQTPMKDWYPKAQ